MNGMKVTNPMKNMNNSRKLDIMEMGLLIFFATITISAGVVCYGLFNMNFDKTATSKSKAVKPVTGMETSLIDSANTDKLNNYSDVIVNEDKENVIIEMK